MGSQLADNSPDSLLHTCVQFVVKEGIDLRGVSLPQEICDLLIQVSYHLCFVVSIVHQFIPLSMCHALRNTLPIRL